jgi:DNA helicase IV
MELDVDHIRITRRGQVATMSLQALTQAPSLRKGMLGTALTIRSQEYDDVTLKGAGHVAATEFGKRSRRPRRASISQPLIRKRRGWTGS